MTTLTIRQQIASDEFVKKLIADIQELPDRIKAAKETLAEAEFDVAVDNAVERAKERVKDLESEAAYIVANETEEATNGKTGEITQKKKWTNETQREMAVRAMLFKNPDYMQTKNELIAAERLEAQSKMRLGKLNIQLKYLIDVYYSNKTIGEIISGLSYEDTTQPRLEAICKKEAILNQTIKELSQ